MPNVMAALPNIGGALCSTPQSLADAHYKNTNKNLYSAKFVDKTGQCRAVTLPRHEIS